ncbi:MAG: acetyl-CoA carboxylase biotin carboxylase subunit [Anaerolineae bacterium]
MFKKILIANRGEIAVRVLRACHELGVQTVAVYSDVDRSALHVRYADEAHHIGPAQARDSYLRVDKLIDAARKSGAEAIHPGYGFLAENPEFAAACEDAGIAFIGPPADAIAAMGDKVEARRLMKNAGVPVIPGTDPSIGSGQRVDLSDDEILSAAAEIGFPVFVKAAAGGGGKGMRLVSDPTELEHSLGAARREAMGAFGDDRVYLERAIQGARHVEIQVLADSQGNTIHLGERECSIQRRHQKLIEESPSTAINDEIRNQMGDVAVRAAEAVGYRNAGTIEFLVDQDRNFYFLEMNTRLQVEHPVTEFVTGVDIVKEQLRVASGRRLRYTQDDIKLRGHAIECRITAEDPYNNFLPSSGRISSIYEPTGPGVRVDAGVYEGFEVSLYYDPLIAKLIVWGDTRGEALLRMRRALAEYRIIGIQTSIPFHQQVMDITTFISGAYDTSFLDKCFSMISDRHGQHSEVAAIVATLLSHESRQKALAVMTPQHGGERVSLWKLAGRRGALR